MLEKQIWPIVIYTIGAPILGIWFILSFLPLSNVVLDWGAPLIVLAHILFFAIGAAGILGSALMARWMVMPEPVSASGSTLAGHNDPDNTNEARMTARVRKMTFLAGYATLWMAIYGAFVRMF